MMMMMMMGGRKRRLVLFFLTVVSLLSFYILCVNLEIHVPWRMAESDRLEHFHAGDDDNDNSPEPSRSQQDSPVFNKDSDHWISTALLRPHAVTVDPTLEGWLYGTAVNEHTSTVTEPRAPTTTTTTTATTTTTTKAIIKPPAKDKSSDPPPPPPPPRATGDRTSESKPAKSDAKDNAKPTSTKESNLKPQLPSARTSAKSTEPPYLGDVYATEGHVPLHTDCPDSLSQRVTSTDLADRFLRRVPVLQWAESPTPEQYERLRQYPGTHGWGVVDYKTLVDTLSVLNTSANWQMFDDWNQRSNRSQCVRCAVVGNGGILKDSKRGREIDRHDYVFRTNGAVIKGFEQDVGSRTTHYTFSTNTLRNSMRSYAGQGYRGPPVSEETRYVFLPDHDRDYLLLKAAATHTPVERGPEHSNKPPNYFGENVSASKFKMYHPDFIRYLRNRFLRSHALKTRYKDIYRPSTGAVMLLAAVHTCDQVSAYGFMTPDFRNYSDHYYDSKYHAVGFFINHDLRMEMSLWQQLHQARLIQLYMRPGTASQP